MAPAQLPSAAAALLSSKQLHAGCRGPASLTGGARGRGTGAGGPQQQAWLQPQQGFECLQTPQQLQRVSRKRSLQATACALQHSLPATASQAGSAAGGAGQRGPWPAPGAAATAPKAPSPAITLASHSTRPLKDRLEPCPALPWALSCRHAGRAQGRCAGRGARAHPALAGSKAAAAGLEAGGRAGGGAPHLTAAAYLH